MGEKILVGLNGEADPVSAAVAIDQNRSEQIESPPALIDRPVPPICIACFSFHPVVDSPRNRLGSADALRNVRAKCTYDCLPLHVLPIKDTYQQAYSSALPLLILAPIQPPPATPKVHPFLRETTRQPPGFNNPFTKRERAMMVCFLAFFLSTVKRGSQVFSRGAAARNPAIVTANVLCRPADTASFDYRVNETSQTPAASMNKRTRNASPVVKR